MSPAKGLGTLLALLLLHPGPSCASTVCNAVTSCGAVPDNVTFAAPALQSCLKSCCVSGTPCTLLFPRNASFLISSLDLSNTTDLTLSFEEGAGLYATTNASLYPIGPFFPPMGNTLCYQAVIFGRNVRNLLLTGPTSAVIDGNGWPWQPLRPTLPYQAPKLLELVDGTNITVVGLTLSNSANWHVHLVYCTRVRFQKNTILGSRAFGGTDGIDPHSSSDVEISGAHIDVGDDGIAITSGTHDRTGALIPSSGILVRDSYIRSRNFAIGSSVLGNVSNVTLQDSRIGDDEGSSPWAIKIKTHSPRGGTVSDIFFQRLVLGKIAPNAYQQPNGGMAFSIYEDYGSPTDFANASITAITRVHFINISGTGARWAAQPFAGGARGSGNITHLLFQNVSLGNVTEHNPWQCSNVSGTKTVGRVQPPLPPECM